ncbi:rhomboid family intramembrane serine protease [uncultured Winogradskyella sp.]|uniref:rhomboid family intramembrane serine protease n=1 Tax=uncultured Winogradskyella sp. TaxID=395353 RepID=UPI0026091838|nr:rhomboid family intramembrane serine protease [uncultured Winogradskyella sp.]
MRLGITDAVKHLLIINVLIFIGTLSIGGGQLFYELFSLYYPQNSAFQPWQIITHMFMHGGGMHLFFNMFALWMFGTAVERQLGTKRFLFVYFSAGLGAVVLTFLVYYFQIFQELSVINSLGLSKDVIEQILNADIVNSEQYFDRQILAEKMSLIFTENNIDASVINGEAFNSFYIVNTKVPMAMVGASGCIMGILAAFGMMNPNAELMMIFLPIPIKAKYFIPGIILLDVISAFTGQSFFSPSNTAFVAHIGGAITGFIIMWFWKKNSMNKYRWDK